MLCHNILLTPFSEDDLPLLFKLYHDPDTMKYLSWVKSLEEANAILQGYIEHWKCHHFGPMAIRDASTEVGLMGRVGLRYSDHNCQIDLNLINGETTQFQLNQKAQLGYVLDPEYRRRGITTVAARTVLDFGFRELGLEEICAFIQIENYASIKLARDKLKMPLKGSFLFYDHLWEYYSLTQDIYMATHR